MLEPVAPMFMSDIYVLCINYSCIIIYDYANWQLLVGSL